MAEFIYTIMNRINKIIQFQIGGFGKKYKNQQETMDQENKVDFSIFQKRRRMMIEIHKQNREHIFLQNRTGSNNQNTSQENQETEQEDDVVSVVASEQSSSMMLSEPMKEEKKNKRKSKISARFGKLLQRAQWMNSVPEELKNFYVTSRPRGKQCILIIEDSFLTLYDKSGRSKLHHNLGTNTHDGTILEVYYVGEYVILVSDLVQWKGNSLASESFQFRQAWLTANITPLKSLIGLSLVIYQPISKQNLISIYKNEPDYQRQGLLFVHKESQYIKGINNNVLLWKDMQTAKFVLETIEEGMEEMSIGGIGRLSKNGFVWTADKQCVGKIDPNLFISKEIAYVKFKFTDLKQSSNNSMGFELVNFSPVKFKPYSRLFADSFSRLVFQYRVRHDPLSIEEIIQRVSF